MSTSLIQLAPSIEEALLSAGHGYIIHEPGEPDWGLLRQVFGQHKLSIDAPISVLPFGGKNRVGHETRNLYFWLAVDPATRSMNPRPEIQDVARNYRALPVNRIVSFGTCNVACPYCKRDCQFIGSDGLPLVTIFVPAYEIVRLAEGAVARGETVRFSGGDPVLQPKLTLALSEYLRVRHSAKTSIAHNGTGPAWVERLLPDLSSAAIDLKGVPEKIGHIMGIDPSRGRRVFELSLDTQGIVSHGGCLLDVRTPVFGDTALDEMRRLAEGICQVNDLAYTFWTWRLYKPVEGCDWPVLGKEAAFQMMGAVSAEFPDVWMGCRAKWNKGGMVYVRDGRVITGSADVEENTHEARGSGNQL